MKTVFIKHGKAMLACLCVAVLGILLLVGGDSAQQAAAMGGIKPIYSVDTRQKAVALSFDAAWGADKTTGIMDILDERGCGATFFLVGFWVDKYPEKAREIAQRGFEIGNHSAHHPRMTSLTPQQMCAEIDSVNATISEVTGVRPTLFRPPFGDYNDAVVQTVRNMDMHCVQWSVDSLDWKELGVDELVKRATAGVKAGDILLFHNNSKYILDALPEILDFLQKKGLKCVTVSQLIHTGDYTVDNNGVQHAG